MGTEAKVTDQSTRAAIVQNVDQTLVKAYGAGDFEEALYVLSLETRLMVRAHQVAISYIPDGDFEAAIHTHSFSEKYEKYNTYDVMPTGKGIWGVIVESKAPMKMTQEEVLSHSRWKNFGGLKDARGLEHPPLRGWLAVPIIGEDGGFLGVLQASDKYEGEFTDEDLDLCTHLAKMVYPTFQLKFVKEALQRVHDELEQRVESRTAELRSTNQQLEVEIAERTRIEEELKNNTEQYRLITDAMPALIAYVDADQRYQFANRGYEDWFGLALGDIRGKHVRDVLGDAGFETLVEHVERALKGQPQFFEAVIADKEGNARDVEARYVPHFDADHKVLGYFVLAVDISERKRAEEERRTIDRKLLETQKLESLGLLAGGIAHDFNNLLTGILGNASLSRMVLPEGSAVLSYLEEIETTSRHAAGLCKQMLAYSGRGRFVIQNLSLSDLIEDMDQLLRLSISKKAVLKLDLPDDLPPSKADASQIRQIVLNLVINASEAIGDQSGLIVVATGMMRADRQYLETAALSPDIAPGDYLFVEVSDNGCGMDAEAKQRIFDPFYTTKFTGRGLGLAAVLGIVRGHKGALKVYSEQGKGSTFKILLPCSDEPESKVASTVTERESRTILAGTILVVDDEEIVRAVAARVLEACGCDVVVAADGREALDRMAERPEGFDAVVLDLTMPHMDGIETFRELIKLNPKIKVLLMSGFNEQEAISQFTGKGLAGFLQKPFDSQDLWFKLQQILEN